MPAPVCVRCGLFFKNKQNGVVIEEGMPTSTKPERWGPYKLWHGDLKECEGCGTQIVVGFGQQPLATHHEPEYARVASSMSPLLRVNDCGAGPFNAERAAERRAKPVVSR